ncbi:YutD family protein [Streptococcus pantholopis]|uniref:Transcriptional regulator n=1 Tax=Streptococcus pantholopis TaxID=1811193 RepID=A0A172Q8L7_9STRE|nr:YutD-like domain-containing protein [Streptococcus pantholopis]AND79772.1 transcriptional regulator [Streptococcus pantholopis]
MRREFSPEMYNYNKFPGPQFVVAADRVKSGSIEFLLLENEKEAFDPKVFSQRFSEILLKYDYIVGDWGNEQLRLKGFYNDSRQLKKSSAISRLPEYIKEYCNFGCAYFILENPEPKTIAGERSEKREQRAAVGYGYSADSETYAPSPKSKRKSAAKGTFDQKHRRGRRTSKQLKKDRKMRKETVNQHFVIRKKEG